MVRNKHAIFVFLFYVLKWNTKLILQSIIITIGQDIKILTCVEYTKCI